LTWIRDVELAAGPFWLATALAVGVIAAAWVTRLARGDWWPLRALRLMAVGLLVLLLVEPVARLAIRTPAKGRVIVGVDLSDSMDASRRATVRRLLDTPRSPLMRLAEDHDLDFVAFAEATTPTTRSGLLERLPAPTVDFAGDATDWRPVLAESARPSTPDAPPTVAVVLVGDGRFHAAGKAGVDDPAGELARRGIPVFPILIGSEAAPPDLAVAGMTAPETAFLDDVAPVEARLVANGFAGRDVTVTLRANLPGKPPFTSTKTIRPATDHERPVVRFQVHATAAGTVPVTITVAPPPDAQNAEARLDNNAAEQTIEVTKEPARVLLIDGEPRWEFRYLRNALARDPRVAVEAVVLHQPSDDHETEIQTYHHSIPETGGEGSDDPLSRFDAVILGDVAAADIPSGFWDRMESHVSQRGGALIVVPGPRRWEELWSGANRPPVLAALSPFTGLKLATVDEASVDPARPALPPGLAVVPTPEALAEQSAWPMFRLPDRQGPWADLPRQPWALTGRLKPGATALAVVSGASPEAVVASQRFGLGRVFWIGFDGTWRWRYRVGDAVHHRFWGQTVRWASASAKLSAGDARVRFGATRARVETGEPVQIRARITEAVTDLPAQPILAARVVRLNDPARPGGRGSETLVPLRALAGLPRTFEADSPPLGSGRYAIRLEAPGIQEAPTAEASFQVVPRATGERVELAATRAHFEPLAKATGGRVVADSEADRLPDLLRPFARTTTVAKQRLVSLWDRPEVLLVFLAIVGAEWIARKRAGLP
jgi:hypothetical protein